MKIIDPLGAHERVAVLGLGASGLAACRLLRALGKQVVASDGRLTAPPPGLPPGCELHLGAHELGGATAAVISPGLNPEWPENAANPALAPIWRAWRAGAIELISEVELGMRACDVPVVAVGGTDGKSTTAALTAHLLSGCGLPALLGGNSWRALSDVVLEATQAGAAARAVVAEVSAFQLQDPHGMRPTVALMTNIANDHLDHYASEADYVRAKRHILRNLGPGATVALRASDPALRAWIEPATEAGCQVVSYDSAPYGSAPYGSGPGAAEPLAGVASGAWVEAPGSTHGLLVVRAHGRSVTVPRAALPLPGDHNARNALAAMIAVAALAPPEVDDATLGRQLAAAMGTFRGLPHRIEWVADVAGVRWYNDSKATNVHAACVGLGAMDRPTIAIVGGADKQLDLEPLIAALADRARATLVIGQLAARLEAEAAGRVPGIERCGTIERAVARAAQLAADGDAVLLAPACSSFDQFRSFEHRGEVFRELVLGLAAQA